MRPKKTVLCVESSELALSVRALQLEVWGYRVVRATSATLAVSLLRQRPGDVDLVLVSLPLAGAVTVLRTAKTLDAKIRTLAVSSVYGPDSAMQYADVFLHEPAAGQAEVRERMRVLLTRKRGPARGFMKALHGDEKKPVQSVHADETLRVKDERRRA